MFSVNPGGGNDCLLGTNRTAGRALSADDFKPQPEGHTGGALNMVPAYAGYLGIDALTGVTRPWLMGQGHCVAAIDSLNLLVGNMLPAHAGNDPTAVFLTMAFISLLM